MIDVPIPSHWVGRGQSWSRPRYITSIEDWHLLAQQPAVELKYWMETARPQPLDYIIGIRNNMGDRLGYYYKLSADLDFTGDTFGPLFNPYWYFHNTQMFEWERHFGTIFDPTLTERHPLYWYRPVGYEQVLHFPFYLDGGNHTISGLDHPLFEDGFVGVIKNLEVEDCDFSVGNGLNWRGSPLMEGDAAGQFTNLHFRNLTAYAHCVAGEYMTGGYEDQSGTYHDGLMKDIWIDNITLYGNDYCAALSHYMSNTDVENVYINRLDIPDYGYFVIAGNAGSGTAAGVGQVPQGDDLPNFRVHNVHVTNSTLGETTGAFCCWSENVDWEFCSIENSRIEDADAGFVGYFGAVNTTYSRCWLRNVSFGSLDGAGLFDVELDSVENCYALITVDELGWYFSGLTSYADSVRNSYVVIDVSEEETSYSDPLSSSWLGTRYDSMTTVSKVLFDQDRAPGWSPLTDVVYGLTTAEMTDGSIESYVRSLLSSGVGAGKWYYKQGEYPSLRPWPSEPRASKNIWVSSPLGKAPLRNTR